MRRNACAVVLGFLVGAAPLWAVELDLDAAVTKALADNPGLKSVEELRAQVAGGVIEARADAFPQLTLASSWGQSRSPAFLNSPDFEEILAQFPAGSFSPATQELYRAVVELKQTVWNFGKVGTAIELAKIVAGAADAEIASARLDTAAATAEAYCQVLAARQGLATIQAERAFRRHDLERIESLLEIGEATELERLRARSALADLEPTVATLEGRVTVAETRLRQLLALEPDATLELAPLPDVLPELPPAERLAELALTERPELRDLELQSEVYAKRKQITHADSLPAIELNGYWGREVRLLDNFNDPLYSTWSFSLGLRWEFFDGGRRRGQIAQFESQRQQLALKLAELEAQVRLETGQALSDYRTALARADSSQIAADAAREALRVARDSFEQGVATQTDLLDAQRRSTSADVLAIAAFYDARIQAARLARAVGRMPTAGFASASSSESEN